MGSRHFSHVGDDCLAKQVSQYTLLLAAASLALRDEAAERARRGVFDKSTLHVSQRKQAE